MSQSAQAAIAVIGIDIGKNSFHVVGHDDRGTIVLRQKWSRGQVETRLANMAPCLIGMEACVGAHHLSRKLKALGHDARLMPAKYVRPYLKGQKNNFRDAEAIAEAVQRPTMKFVATKTAEQLDLQALHRVRERFVSQRTGIINQIRAFLLERGIAVRQGVAFPACRAARHPGGAQRCAVTAHVAPGRRPHRRLASTGCRASKDSPARSRRNTRKEVLNASAALSLGLGFVNARRARGTPFAAERTRKGMTRGSDLQFVRFPRERPPPVSPSLSGVHLQSPNNRRARWRTGEFGC